MNSKDHTNVEWKILKWLADGYCMDLNIQDAMRFDFTKYVQETKVPSFITDHSDHIDYLFNNWTLNEMGIGYSKLRQRFGINYWTDTEYKDGIAKGTIIDLPLDAKNKASVETIIK